MEASSRELSFGWFWKQRSGKDDVAQEHHEQTAGWNKTLSIPSEIHSELLKIGKIPDTRVGFNEHKIHWVGESEWLYSTVVQAQESEMQDGHAEIVFEGLDTVCNIYINGLKVLRTENQFRTFSVPLDLKAATQPTYLMLHFESAKLVAKDLEARFGRVRAGSCNLGDPSRVYLRKAQYDWRWDWGPEIITVGPYRPIKLHAYSACIADLFAHAFVSDNLARSLSVRITSKGNLSEVTFVEVSIKDNQGRVVRDNGIDAPGLSDSVESELLKWEFEADEVQLWWPVGYGGQALYTVEVCLMDSKCCVLDSQTQRIGFRRVELVQEPLTVPDQYGTGSTFLFEVNNVRMFMGGSNWVPADNLLTTVTAERIRAWLTLLKDGNQNMVRLWGGGVYEPDIFYDTCDELGILVWQDFQFACGVYPAHEEFVQNVKAEAEDNVRRLRRHASLALFCGNNEDYQQVLQWGGIKDLPARIIYEEVLPGVVSSLTYDNVPYHRGSPYGGKGWDTADPTTGDVHQWNVWAGQMKTYWDYDLLGGRFVSEFGLPAFPSMRTIDYWLDGSESQRYAQSKLMAQHCKAGSHEQRFAFLMNDNFRATTDLETHVFNTQAMQADALGWAYRAWRREWKGRGKEYTAGALVWQLNDCWPVTSWAIADYFLRPKPAYYVIARDLKPFAVGIFRDVEKNREHDRPRQFYEFGAFQSICAWVQIWGANSTLASREAVLQLRFFDLESDWTHEEEYRATMAANQSTELVRMLCPEPPPHSGALHDKEPSRTTCTHRIIITVRLLDAQSQVVLARLADWPKPYRYYDFPDPELSTEVDGENVRLRVKKPVRNLVLSVDGDPEVKWSDNALDVNPGDPQEVLASGLAGRVIKVAYMGREARHIPRIGT